MNAYQYMAVTVNGYKKGMWVWLEEGCNENIQFMFYWPNNYEVSTSYN